MRDPQDYDSVGAFMKDDSAEYPALTPLAQRTTSEVRIKSPDGEKEDNRFSAPIAAISRMTQKLYGYMRDGNIEGHLEQTAVKGTNSLHDLLFDAPCVNRQGRYDEEEKRAQQWLSIVKSSPEREGADSAETVEDLLQRWGEADAFMLYARIVEEKQGIPAAEPLYEKYVLMEKQRQDVEEEAAALPPAWNMFFGCRRRQYGIMRERTYDLAMEYPIYDCTDVKREIAEGADVHDLVHRMLWPFRESYQAVMGSGMDGEAHRTLLMSTLAGQLPQPQMPWGMGMPPWGMGMSPNGQSQDGDGDDSDDQPDKRRPLFKWPGGKRNGGAPEQPKPINRRRSRRGRNK